MKGYAGEERFNRIFDDVSNFIRQGLPDDFHDIPPPAAPPVHETIDHLSSNDGQLRKARRGLIIRLCVVKCSLGGFVRKAFHALRGPKVLSSTTLFHNRRPRQSVCTISGGLQLTWIAHTKNIAARETQRGRARQQARPVGLQCGLSLTMLLADLET